jgi:hypothetical protein
MAFQGNFNDALEMVRSGWLDKQSDSDLERMLEVLRRYDSAYPGHENKSAIDAIENDKARRQKQQHHETEKALHEKTLSQGKVAHQETMQELDALKGLVRRVPALRWIDWAILIFGAVAATAAVLQLLKY